MTADYYSIISAAKRQHEEKIAAGASRRTSDQARKRALAEAGIQWLQEHVRQELERAKDEFTEAGLIPHMEENFDSSDNGDSLPSLVFFCSGPSKPYQFGGPAKSDILYVASNGSSVRVGFGSPGTRKPDTWGSPQPVSSVDIIKILTEAAKRVVDSYYSRA